MQLVRVEEYTVCRTYKVDETGKKVPNSEKEGKRTITDLQLVPDTKSLKYNTLRGFNFNYYVGYVDGQDVNNLDNNNNSNEVAFGGSIAYRMDDYNPDGLAGANFFRDINVCTIVGADSDYISDDFKNIELDIDNENKKVAPPILKYCDHVEGEEIHTIEPVTEYTNLEDLAKIYAERRVCVEVYKLANEVGLARLCTSDTFGRGDPYLDFKCFTTKGESSN